MSEIWLPEELRRISPADVWLPKLNSRFAVRVWRRRRQK